MRSARLALMRRCAYWGAKLCNPSSLRFVLCLVNVPSYGEGLGVQRVCSKFLGELPGVSGRLISPRERSGSGAFLFLVSANDSQDVLAGDAEFLSNPSHCLPASQPVEVAAVDLFPIAGRDLAPLVVCVNHHLEV